MRPLDSDRLSYSSCDSPFVQGVRGDVNGAERAKLSLPPQNQKEPQSTNQIFCSYFTARTRSGSWDSPSRLRFSPVKILLLFDGRTTRKRGRGGFGVPPDALRNLRVLPTPTLPKLGARRCAALVSHPDPSRRRRTTCRVASLVRKRSTARLHARFQDGVKLRIVLVNYPLGGRYVPCRRVPRIGFSTTTAPRPP